MAVERTAGAAGSGIGGAWRRLSGSQNAYYALILSILAGGILLMVLPAELLNYTAPEKPTLDLKA